MSENADFQTGVYDVQVGVNVEVTIQDPQVVSRCVENEDGWRETFYDLRSAADVIQHLAYNCAANGVESANRLDGWADIPAEAATMRLVRTDVDEIWAPDGSYLL